MAYSRAHDAAMDLGDIIACHAGAEGPLLPILHDVQARFGHVSEEAEREIAAALNLSRAEVHGVVSFYHDFTAVPADKSQVRLCRAEACQARGVDALLAALPESVAARLGTIYCLGMCSVGPAAIRGGESHARLDAVRLAALVEQA